MTITEVGSLVGMGTAVVFGFRWLNGLESRQIAHERTCDERMRRLDERHGAILRSLQDIKETVDRL